MLPEISLLSEQLSQVLTGKTVDFAHLGHRCGTLRSVGMVNLSPADFTRALEGKTVVKTWGEGRWLFVLLEPDTCFLLGEEGDGLRYYGGSSGVPSDVRANRRNYVLLDFDDGSTLVHRIPRKGFIKVIPRDSIPSSIYPGVLGVSPVDSKRFTLKVFRKMLKQRRQEPVRTLLTDQTQIAGLGDPYVDDALHGAGIRPGRESGDLSRSESNALYLMLDEILHEAMGLGGATDSLDLFGKPGRYKQRVGEHLIGKPCPTCRKSVRGSEVDGAIAYFCPSCQH